MTTQQKKWLKWAIFGLILLAIIATAYYFLKPKPQAPSYITATVEKSSIENSVMATGKVEGLNQVDVGAQVSGEVTKLYVDVGDTVQKGDVIAQIDPVTMSNNLTTQQANLQQSMASLESSKANYVTKQKSLATAKAELKGKLADGGRNDNPACKGRRIGRQLAALCSLKLGKRRIVDIEIGHQ